MINKRGSDDVEFSSLIPEVDNAFLAWRLANGSVIDFTRAVDPSSSAIGTRPGPDDFINVIVWDEDPRNNFMVRNLDFARVVRTVDGNSGEVLDVDIVLNGYQYLWTAQADGNFSGQTGPLDVQEVLTKAVGELIGLNVVPTSGHVMEQIDFAGNTSRLVLTADELAAVLDVYPPPAAPPVTSISGRVTRSGMPVFGAYAVAFQGGAPVVGAITDAIGNYSIRRLPSGAPNSYTVRVVTLQPPPPGTLSFYVNLNNDFLSESYLNLATDPGTVVMVSQGVDTPGINLEVAGASTPDPWEPDDTTGTARVIATDGTRQIHHTFPAGNADHIKFSAVAGHFYVVETSNLGSGAVDFDSDTVISLTGPSGELSNDDRNPKQNEEQRSRTSRIVFLASAAGEHFVRTTQFIAGASGSGTAYDISVTDLGTTLPAPTVSSVVPSEGFLSGGYQVMVLGTNFVADASVAFGGIPATEVDVASPSKLFVTVPQGAAIGPVNVVVTNLNGSASPPGGFTYLEEVTERFVDATFPALSSVPFLGNTRASGWPDYDNDGDLDLYLTISSDSTGSARLVRNEGNETFTDVSVASGAISEIATINPESVSWGDFNNDGCIDVYKVNFPAAPNNSLLRNECNGTFTNVTNMAGVAGGLGRTRDAAWADFDNDGFLDLFVAFDDNLQGRNQLFRNNGNGTFIDVAAQAGVADMGIARNVNWADFNTDGWADLFLVKAGTQPDILYRNNRDGTFTDVTASSGLTDTPQGVDAVWGDFNNDGRPDLYVISTTGLNKLFLNTATGMFLDISLSSGTNNTFGSSQAAAVGDFNNDGWLDIFVAQAFDGRDFSEVDFLFKNTGEDPLRFEDATVRSGIFDLDFFDGLTAAFGDFTGTGAPDLFVGNRLENTDFLYRNNANKNDWLVVRLVGTFSNKLGAGARVVVTADVDNDPATPPVAQTREVMAGSKGQSPVMAVFGLGKTKPETRAVDELTVFWPSGVVSGPFSTLARNQIVTVFEGLPGIVVARVTPRSGPTSGGTTVTVGGENFDPDATVRFSGLAGSVVSRTGTSSITVTTPAHAAGLVDVTVTNPSRSIGDMLREGTLRNGFLYFTGDPLNTLTIFDPVDTTLAWGTVVGAIGYDVIRGNVSSLQIVSGQVDLGSLVCIENESTDTTTAPNHIDQSVPSAGQAFFYLFRVSGGTYGSSSAGLLRVAGPGACP